MSETTEGRETAPLSFLVKTAFKYGGGVAAPGDIVTPETDAEREEIRIAQWFGHVVVAGDNPEPPVAPELPADAPESSPVPPMTTQDAPNAHLTHRPRGRR
jgi:hypothetical protein